MDLPKVLVITGPTASGKSAVGALLALKIGGEVVSADSMQVYEYMDIGTAKPTVSEMRGVTHHMISVVSPLEDYSVARYVTDASECVDDILSRGKVPVIVGGTGLYIDSLLRGRGFCVRGDERLRHELEDEYDELGGEFMLRRLSAFDAEAAQRLHVNDRKRIVRAIEVFMVSGKVISEHDSESALVPPRYDAMKFALSFTDRAVLYERINRRVDLMMDNGFEREVHSLLSMGVAPSSTAMQAIGYNEMVSVLLDECSMDEAVEKIKMESRRYAKRQLTWLRRDIEVSRWIEWDVEPDVERAVEEIENEAK